MPMHFSAEPLTLVDASAFPRDALTADDLFDTPQHIAFVAPPRSGKSAAGSYGMLRDLEKKRPVLFLTCQSPRRCFRSPYPTRTLADCW